jgi:hypothetical protein
MDVRIIADLSDEIQSPLLKWSMGDDRGKDIMQISDKVQNLRLRIEL